MGVKALGKARYQACRHCTAGKGCSVYDTRPQECRDFECMWLRDARLPDRLRPDRSRAIITTTNDGQGLVVHVDPARPDAHRREPLRTQLLQNAKRGVPVIVSIGPDRCRLLRPDGSELSATMTVDDDGGITVKAVAPAEGPGR
jgi:hypothetical protein